MNNPLCAKRIYIIIDSYDKSNTDLDSVTIQDFFNWCVLIEYIFLYNLNLNSELFLSIQNSYKCLNSKNAIYLSKNAYFSLSVASRLCYAYESNPNLGSDFALVYLLNI